MHKTTPVPTSLFVVAVLAATYTVFSIAHVLEHAVEVDFGMFYASGRDWMDGASPYVGDRPRLNMNPPVVTVLLFQWLARLPMRPAAALLTVLGGLSITLTFRLIARRLRWDARTTSWVVATALLAYPSQSAWQRGQITWLLLYPATRAWLAYREGRHRAAGAWLAPLVAVKPILALLPMLLGWPILWVAGLGSLGLTVAGVMLTGWDDWNAWLRAGTSVFWYGWPNNASIWGMLVRAAGARSLDYVQLHIVPGPWLVLAALCLAIMGGITWATRHPDRRWAMAGCFVLAASPLGWAYYLPLFMGALVVVALARPPRVFWLGIALCCFVPLPVIRLIPDSSPLIFATLGSLYWWGIVCLWLGAAAHDRRGKRRAGCDAERTEILRGIGKPMESVAAEFSSGDKRDGSEQEVGRKVRRASCRNQEQRTDQQPAGVSARG
jgi:hypothetical protein